MWLRVGHGSLSRSVLAAVMDTLLAQKATKHICQPGPGWEGGGGGVGKAESVPRLHLTQRGEG